MRGNMDNLEVGWMKDWVWGGFGYVETWILRIDLVFVNELMLGIGCN